MSAVPARPVRALARVEGIRILRHPAFLAGLAIVAIGTTFFVRETVTNTFATWDDDAWTAGVAFLVLAILTMIATNLAALRDRRSGAIEQHTSLPVDITTRTVGLLVSALVPAVVGVVLFGAVLVFGWSREALPAVELVRWLELGVLFLLFGAIGIALAVWTRTAIVAAVVAWGMFLITPGEQPPSWQILWPLALPETVGLAAWHLVELLGLTLVVAAVALRRTSRRRSIVLVGAAGLCLVIASAAVMIPRACAAPHVCSF